MAVSIVPLAVSLGLVLVGVMATWWGARELRRTAADLRRFHRADGEVVDVRQDWSGDGSTYHPVVRFRTADGGEVRATSRHGDRAPGAGTARRVTVCYDPDDPQDVFIAGWWRSGMGTWTICVVVGVAFAALGLYGLSVLYA